jgi:hypothetical protein
VKPEFPGIGTDKEKSILTKILPRNEGTIDRVLRVLVGLGLLSLVFVGPQTPWGWIGVVPLLTGLIGSCPVYTLLGMSTCPIKERSS